MSLNAHWQFGNILLLSSDNRISSCYWIGATATSSQGVYLLNSSLENFVGGEGNGGGVGEGNRDGNDDGNGDGKGDSNGDMEGNRQGKGEGYIVN